MSRDPNNVYFVAVVVGVNKSITDLDISAPMVVERRLQVRNLRDQSSTVRYDGGLNIFCIKGSIEEP